MLPTVRAVLHYPITASYRADTQAWLDVATGNYSTAERQALDALLGGFATDGILSFDRLWALQFGDNEADSLRCIVSRQSATKAGATPPTFVRRQGWQGNTSTGFINTNWAPSTGVNFLQDSSSAGCHVRRVSTVTGILRMLLGVQNASNQNCINVGILDNNTVTFYRVNSSTVSQDNASIRINSDNTYYSVSRANSTDTVCRKDSTEFASAAATTGRSVLNAYLLARNLNGSVSGQANHQMSMAHFGAAQTTAQNANFRSRMDTFNTAIGYVP